MSGNRLAPRTGPSRGQGIERGLWVAAVTMGFIAAVVVAIATSTFATSAFAAVDEAAPVGYIAIGSGGSVTPAQDAAAKIVTENACSGCHAFSYVDGSHDSEGVWVATINRMQAYGMSVSAAEESQILGYLVRHYGTSLWSPGAPFTNALAVVANLEATDTGGSGLSQMRLSNDGAFDDTAGVEAWRPFSSTFTWSLLAGDGAKTVRAQFKDVAGNISETATDGIVLDTALPSAAMKSLPPYSTAVSKTATFPVAWTGSDSSSGVSAYDVQYRTGATGAWKPFRTGTTATSSKLSGFPGDSYYLRVRSIDGAGNVGLYSSARKTVVPYDERRGKFSSGWSALSSSSKPFFMKTAKASKKAKASATFKLTGKRFALIVTKGPKNGVAKVYVDGVLKKTIDTRSSSTKYRQAISVASFGSVGPHKIKVINRATSGRPNLVLDGVAAER